MAAFVLSLLLLAAPHTTLGILRHELNELNELTQELNQELDLGLKSIEASPARNTMDADMSNKIQATMKEFVALSGGARASLIIHGDSTQSGLSARINEALGKEDIYSFYSCVNWGEKCNAVTDAALPTTQMILSSKFGDVLNNVNNAFSVLRGCNGGYTGGAIWVTSHLDGKLIKYMWSFSPENRFGACWNSCLNKAIKALQPNAVVVNQGLHLLHLHPGRPCDTGSFFHCGDYQDNVENILTSLREVSPVTLWRMTNWICDAKYNKVWKKSLNDWKNSSSLASMENQCRKECKAKRFNDDNPCAKHLLDSGGSWNQFTAATRAIEAVNGRSGSGGRIGSVDAFLITYGQCTLTSDARHYKGLDAVITLQMAEELVRLYRTMPS